AQDGLRGAGCRGRRPYHPRARTEDAHARAGGAVLTATAAGAHSLIEERQHMSDSTSDRIRESIESNKILIYMKGSPSFPMCGFSAATIEVFEEIGVPYNTVDVLKDPEIREGIKRYSNWPTIPQVYIAGKFVGG